MMRKLKGGRAIGRWLGTLALMLLAMGSLGAVEVPYVEPAFAEPLFNADALSLDADAADEMAGALAVLAANFPGQPEIGNEVRMKAIALALRLDSMHPTARRVNDELIADAAPAPVEDDGRFPRPADVAAFLWEEAVTLGEERAEPGDAALAPYLMDIALAVDPAKRAERAPVFAGLPEKTLAWEKAISLPAPPEPDPAPVVEPPAETEMTLRRTEEREENRRRVAEAVREKQALREQRMEGMSGSSEKPRQKPAEPDAEYRRTTNALRVVIFEASPEASGDEAFRRRRARAVPCRLSVEVTEGERSQPKNPFHCDAGIDPTFYEQVEVMAELLRADFQALPRGGRLDFKLTSLEDGRALPLSGRQLGLPVFLLLESLLTGDEIDPGVSVIGALGASGDVQTGALEGSDRGRWWAMIKEVAEAGAGIVVVPSRVEDEFVDPLVADSFLPLLQTQVVQLDDRKQIAAIARANRSGETAEALRLFSEVQELDRMTPEDLVRNVKVMERFQAVSRSYPPHLSARLLLSYGAGRLPATLSLQGSVNQIEGLLAEVVASSQSSDRAVMSSSIDDVCSESLFALRRMRPKLAIEANSYADAASSFIERYREYLSLSNRTTSIAQQKAADVAEAKAEMDSVAAGLYAAMGK